MRSARPLLIAIFVASSLLEIAVTAVSFFAPHVVAAQLHLGDDAGVARLAFFARWLILFFAVVCCVATWKLIRRSPDGELLAGVFGLVFFGMGIAFFVQFHEAQLLVMDTLRGAAILALLAVVRRDG
jgi:hypothetical protein